MKKKLLILSASIGLLLACFPFTLYAEEDPESDLGLSAPVPYYQLDEYFYENYDPLPYIESDGTQYINTGINGSSELRINFVFSDLDKTSTVFLFGESKTGYNLIFNFASSNGSSHFNFCTSDTVYDVPYYDYQRYDYTFDKNEVYLGNQYLGESTYTAFTSDRPIYIFTVNRSTISQSASYKLYAFSIYDYSLNSGDGGYVRYYYPARAKSGGTIGLYDAVSKTFFTTASSSPFENPSGNLASAGLISTIGYTVFNSLDWIGDILGFAIAEPVIILFMAIGLAGAMFRWGRRLVHF